MGSTNFFSLKKFNSEGRLSDDNYKFTDRDRSTIDSLLWTLVNHDHRETSSEGTLAGPSEPTLTVDTTGGNLSSGTSYYYKLSFVDASGNETGASNAIIANTADPVASPAVQTLSSVSTGGALVSGIYRYSLSYYQTAGGETRAANISTIIVPTGTSTNVITVGLLTPPDDVDGWKVYRKSPDDSDYHYLTSIARGGTPPTSWDDNGSVEIDCTKIRPSSNTTNTTSMITVDINSSDIPLDTRIAAWKIYRTTNAGIYSSSSLLATVVETATEGGGDLVTTWDDVGGSTVAGSPLTESVVPPPIPQLDASAIFASGAGRLPSDMAPAGVRTFNMLCPGTITAKSYNQFYIPHDMYIERVDAFFLGAPDFPSGSDYLTLRFSDDATADEEQELYNDAITVNEIQSVYNNATSGTFTLSDGTDTTDPIDFDAIAGEVATRLETDIASITSVQVTGIGTPAQPWYVMFVDPGGENLDVLIAGDGSLVGGTSTVTTETNGSDGGTFTLTDGTDTTATIVFDALAATIETRLETDIASITAVTVTGAGTLADPWVILWVTPGGTDVNLLTVSDTSLNGTSFISETVKGHGVTQVDTLITTDDAQYHYWQSTATDYGEQEAESAPATGGTSVSDAFATNDVAMELDTQNEINSWTVGSGLDAGDYVAKFYASGTGDTGTYVIRVIDTVGPTTVSTMTVSDGSLYIPAHELLFTDTGAETWKFEIEKTDAGTGVIRIDKYEYEVVLPVLHGGGTATVEVRQSGTPTSNGSDIQVTAWY